MLEKVFGSSKPLEKSLDAAWLRNEAIAQNIANVSTPNYKRKTVAFEEYLTKAIEEPGLKGFMTDSRHISIGGRDFDSVDIKISEDNTNLQTRLDGNNVDIEVEAASLAKNSIKYNVMIQSLNGGFKKLRSAISEGR